MCYFGLLNSHVAWSMSFEQMVAHSEQMQETMNKWHLSATLAEELTDFTAVVETDNMTDLHSTMASILEK